MQDKLYINGRLIDSIDLSEKSLTLQVNDIGQLESRQTDFSDTIDIPMTENNRVTFDFLNVNGSQSQLPYSKISIDWIRNGKYLVKDGWGIIKKFDSDSVSLFIQKGLVDFFKAIGNDNIGLSLSLTELNHTKNVSVVKEKLEDTTETPFTYILADYNGLNQYNGSFNIDYLPPAINWKYLLNKISAKYGYTFTSEIDDQFISTWITYPKLTGEELFVETELANGHITENVSVMRAGVRQIYYKFNGTGFSFTENQIDSSLDAYGLSYFVAPEDGLYKFKMSQFIGTYVDPYGLGLPTTGTTSSDVFPMIYLVKSTPFYYTTSNPLGITFVTPVYQILFFDTKLYTNHYNDIEQTDWIFLKKGEYIYPYTTNGGKEILTYNCLFQVYIKELTNADISNEMKDFKVADFMKETLWRFGLSAYPEGKNIKLWRIKDQQEKGNVIDLSEYYNESLTTETQAPYAQINYLKHKYYDEKENHLDGSLIIKNENLPATKTVLQSVFYAPRKDKSDLQINGTYTHTGNVYQMVDKSVEDYGTISYKHLDKRYHVIKRKLLNQTVSLTSQTIGSAILANNVHVEDSMELGFNTMVDLNYTGISGVLNNYQKKTISVRLDEAFIETLDLSSLVYFKQLGNYYIINKIVYAKDKSTIELIKVDINFSLNIPINTGIGKMTIEETFIVK